MRGRVLIVSGERGAGKTTLCARPVERARRAGWRVGGILCPARYAAGRKVEIDLVTLPDGQRYPLAQVVGPGEGATVGRYRFDEGLFSLAERAVAQAVPCDLLLVDELGPLELEEGRGWARAIEVVAGGRFELALVVVRPELVESARGRFGGREVEAVRVSRENREGLAVRLAGWLVGLKGPGAGA